MKFISIDKITNAEGTSKFIFKKIKIEDFSILFLNKLNN